MFENEIEFYIENLVLIDVKAIFKNIMNCGVGTKTKSLINFGPISVTCKWYHANLNLCLGYEDPGLVPRTIGSPQCYGRTYLMSQAWG